MKTCENCGCAVYKLGCTNCDESNYIEQQNYFNSLPEVYETHSDNISQVGDLLSPTR